MQQSEAIRLLSTPELDVREPQTWTDLGCGDGVFTRALASLLAPQSTIHAMDRDVTAMKALPREHHGVRIRPWVGDVTAMPWPFGTVDGVLAANLLHFVRSQASFLRGCREQISPRGHLLVVEYDTDRSNRWVPYPVRSRTLTDLCTAAGFARAVILRSRASIYQRAPLYSVLAMNG